MCTVGNKNNGLCQVCAKLRIDISGSIYFCLIVNFECIQNVDQAFSWVCAK